MKNINIFKAITLFSAVIFLQAFSATGAKAYTACTFNSDNQISTDMSSFGICNADPTHRKVLAYKVGLCTELPYDTNYKQVCDFIYDKTTPIELEAIKNASVSVTGFGEITLTEGTEYTHTVVLISNTTYVKSLFSFPSDRQGASGTGRWCWSNGGGVTTKDRTEDPMTLKGKFTVECGSESEANPKYNSETNNAFGSAIEGEDQPALVRNFPTWAAEESYTNRGWTNILMSDEDTKAVFETTPPNWNTPNTNSVYWLAGRSINPSVSVNANTSILDLKFLVSYGGVVWYSGDANTGDDEGDWHTDCDDTTPCIGRIRIGGFDMNVSAE
ncbi:hypothetical protein N9B84_04900 [Amylibacter sp.]|jgi:hypothetical protein|nr:hypothetical protein [Amylibacter sp.]